jgi:hypothetical protein
LSGLGVDEKLRIEMANQITAALRKVIKTWRVDIEIDVCRRISKVQLLPETVKSQLLLMLPDFYSRMMKIH